MSTEDFKEYPMMLYHPKTQKPTVVQDEDEHIAVISGWDESGDEGEGADGTEKRKPGRPRKPE